ncbi:cytochrome P450 [Mycena crocata]|nr:cytochrome P450 [Mycena crocata]
MDSYLSHVLASLLVIAFSAATWAHLKNSGLRSIPAIGPSGFFSSYLGAHAYLRNAPKIVQEGYNKYKSSVFRVPYWDKWVVVVSSPQLVHDLRQSRDEDLSAVLGFGAIFAANYTLGPAFVTNDYHVKVIQSSMTRSITSRFADIKNEVWAAFQDEIQLYGDGREWTAAPALLTILRVTSRASNRLFVGLPLCRNTDYRNLTVEFAMNAMDAAKRINLFPHFLKPIVGPMLSHLPRDMKRAKKHLVPLIEERLRLEAHGPNWSERPNDLISWLLEHAEGEERTPDKLTQRILMVNFVAIHTSANSFTQALYHLAQSCEYVGPLRQELEAAVREEGWTKTAMSKCIKMDSFLRESQRFNGASAVNINRIVVNPAGYTFSDGTHIPTGTFLAAATHATHHDELNYENPDVFDGFRFANMRGDDEQRGSIKYQMVAPDVKYLSFGLGRHACPGRFFAVNELKLMMAHILETYDVKLEGTNRPPTEWFGTMAAANRSGKVLFRKRIT